MSDFNPLDYAQSAVASAQEAARSVVAETKTALQEQARQVGAEAAEGALEKVKAELPAEARAAGREVGAGAREGALGGFSTTEVVLMGAGALAIVGLIGYAATRPRGAVNAFRTINLSPKGGIVARHNFERALSKAGFKVIGGGTLLSTGEMDVDVEYRSGDSNDEIQRLAKQAGLEVVSIEP